MSNKTGAATDRDVFGRVWTLKGDLRQRDVAAWNRAILTTQTERRWPTNGKRRSRRRLKPVGFNRRHAAMRM